MSWIRPEDRNAMKLGSFSPAAHGDLAALTGLGGGSEAGGSYGRDAGPSSARAGAPEPSSRASAPIRVVVAQPFRIPPPVRLPPPPAPCPALQAAERRASSMAGAAGADDAFEKRAIDLADEDLPTFLDVRGAT